MEIFALIGNVYPYEITQWTRDPNTLPPLTFPDIFADLVLACAPPISLEILNPWKLTYKWLN